MGLGGSPYRLLAGNGAPAPEDPTLIDDERAEEISANPRPVASISSRPDVATLP